LLGLFRLCDHFVVHAGIGSWLCGECAICSSCGKKAPSGEKTSGFKHLTTKERLNQKDGDEVYLTTLCEDCNKEFEKQNFCPVCLKTHAPISDSPSRSKKAKRGKSDTDQATVQCKGCERNVHFPGCDLAEFEGADGQAYLDGKKDYTCSLCRSQTLFETRPTSPRRKATDASDTHLTKESIELDSADETEYERRYEEKNRPKKRGRPPKRISMQMQLELEKKEKEAQELMEKMQRKPFKKREVAYFGGHMVAIPLMRRLKRF
jgi:positive regulator of sigma E activity